VLGAIVWSVSIVLAGYFLGTVPVIQTNLNLLVYFVVILTIGTVLLIIYKLVKTWRYVPASE
jgi:membrane-associated protein